MLRTGEFHFTVSIYNNYKLRLRLISERLVQKRSILKIQWKQQHINNACAPACVAMLLSHHNILKEDFDIIYESKRPYMVEFNEHQNSFCAGILIQSDEIMNIVPNKFDLKFILNKFDNFDNYYEHAVLLMKNKTPFITSLAQGFIPSPGYTKNKSKGGHAIVVYKLINDEFYFLDPDGGINRKKENKFEEVSEQVSYKIHKKEMKDILTIRNKYIISTLEKFVDFQTESDIPLLLDNSKKAISKLSHVSKNELLRIISNDKSVDYNDFYSFIIRIIKPFALDLKNALITIPNPTNHEKELIVKLNELFDESLSIQRMLKANPKIDIEICLKKLQNHIIVIEKLAANVITLEIQKFY